MLGNSNFTSAQSIGKKYENGTNTERGKTADHPFAEPSYSSSSSSSYLGIAGIMARLTFVGLLREIAHSWKFREEPMLKYLVWWDESNEFLLFFFFLHLSSTFACAIPPSTGGDGGPAAAAAAATG